MIPIPGAPIAQPYQRTNCAGNIGKKTFVAECDLSADRVENGKGWLKIKKASWVVHGENKGLEGSFGFMFVK